MLQGLKQGRSAAQALVKFNEVEKNNREMRTRIESQRKQRTVNDSVPPPHAVPAARSLELQSAADFHV